MSSSSSKVEVIIPWRPEPHRERALRWVTDRYRLAFPAWRLTVAEAPEGPWVKALAAMPAVKRSSADVIVLADADVFCERIGDAVQAVENRLQYAIPHCRVHRLTRDATDAVLDGEPWATQPTERRPYEGVRGGGIIVARRQTLLDIPLDPRFENWGQEDQSLGIALWCLLGPPWRSSAPLVHLWHPPQERMRHKVGSSENWALYQRYFAARSDPQAMRQLLEEASEVLAQTSGVRSRMFGVHAQAR